MQLITSPTPTVKAFHATSGAVAGESEKKKAISGPTISALNTTGGMAAGMARPFQRMPRSR